MAVTVLAPGSVFAGDFKVVRTLQEGGMGVVYVAVQLSTGKERALKLMSSGPQRDDTMVERFAREARVGSLIKSNHVVDVIGAGVDVPTNTPWLAMELLEGEDLADYVVRVGALPRPYVHALFSQLCEALGAAHAIPIVHRDLKPANIYLARSTLPNVPFIVKVLDFGIAKILSAPSGTSGAIGTPLWMAPEQTQPGASITPSADVWSLGLIAFYVLTGHEYWRSANTEGATTAAILREVVLDPLETAGARAESYGKRDLLPVGFDLWFARCVTRAPEERFRTAAEAWKALAPLLEGPELHRGGRTVPSLQRVPLLTLPEEAAPHAAPPPEARTSKKFIVLGVVATLVLGGGGLVLIWTKRAPPLETVNVPAGELLVGGDAPNESPKHKVSVGALVADAHEVTVRAYASCVTAGACAPPLAGPRCNWERPEREGDPINCVSHLDAERYCRWRGARLPTESEWEYLARGAEARAFPWGATAPDDDQLCWRRDDAEVTCPVRAHPRGNTSSGLVGLGDNVMEWTASPYCPYDSPCDTRSDPSPSAKLAVRGGSWRATDASAVRATARMPLAPTVQVDTVGLRCVVSR
jgi:serine/threonine protein kinase/formylglycine-generating enzyme required for sulfatase activity